MVAGFVITLAIISYSEVSRCKQLPWPPRIIGTGLVFGLLDLFSFVSEELAGVVAIGIVLAAIVNKGFVTNCSHTEAGTTQPPSYKSLQNAAGTIL
jgi:hypothetical protein